MISESNISNVMLTGQTAYLKKNGSMTNHGTIELENALSSYEYSDGYIGPNSILHGTDLAITEEYTQCESAMKDYLKGNWEEKEGERTIITNSNKIKDMLLPGEINMQTLCDNIGFRGTELEYIQSSGTQYINTKIIPSNHTIEIKAQYLNSANNTTLLGVGSTDFHITWYDSKWYYGNGTTELNGGGAYTCTNVNTFIYGYNRGFYINNNAINSSATPYSNGALCLLYRPNTPASSPSARIYYCKIYDGDTLVRNYIPAETEYGEVCLYDKITKTYFYNEGTGNFIAGPVI